MSPVLACHNLCYSSLDSPLSLYPSHPRHFYDKIARFLPALGPLHLKSPEKAARAAAQFSLVDHVFLFFEEDGIDLTDPSFSEAGRQFTTPGKEGEACVQFLIHLCNKAVRWCYGADAIIIREPHMEFAIRHVEQLSRCVM